MGKSLFANLSPANKYILVCCFSMFVVNGLYAMVLGPLLPYISNEYNLSDTISGMLLSAHQAGALVAGFVAGILPFYMGRKLSIVLLCTFVMVGLIAIVLTGNPILLITGFLFTGISRGGISNFNNTVVTEVTNGNAPAINFLHSSFAVGALASPFLLILGIHIAGDFGWRLTALVLVVLVGITVVMLACAKIEKVDKAARRAKLSYKFLKDRHVWYNTGVLFFYLCVEAGVTGWLVKYFVDTGTLTSGYAFVLASLLWAVMLVGRLCVAFMGSKLSRKAVLAASAVGMTIFYIILLATQSATLITVAIGGFGLSMAAVYPTAIANLGKTIKHYPMSIGVVLVISGIGAIVMPIVTGVLSDAFGIWAGMSAIIAAIIMMMICAGLVIFDRSSLNAE